MSANIRFYAENIFDAGTITATIEDAEYPATNIQHCHRVKRWHSGDLDYYEDSSGGYYDDGLGDYYGDNVEIRYDVGVGGQIAGYVAVINPNITSGELIIRATDNADYSSDLLLNESFSVSPKVFGYGQDKYGKHGYGGTLLSSEMERYAPGGRILLHHFTGGLVGARYWSLVIPLSCGKEDDYYAIGRIFAGLWHEPTHNIEFGYTLMPIDDSVIKLSRGGQPWLDVAPKKRAMEFNFPAIKKTEARYDIFDLFQEYGKRNDIIIRVFPDGTQEEKMFDTIYGRFTDPPGITAIQTNYYIPSKQILFMESL